MARPPKKQDDFNVLVPLSKLMGLLDSAQRVDDMSNEMDSLKAQLTALRGQFLELMERFAELE